jgi:hypothetical protein
MFAFIKNLFSTEPTPMVAFIEQSPLGFNLVTRSGDTVGTYTRRRDAVRGAKRRGLAVA